MRIIIDLLGDEGVEVDKMEEGTNCPIATQDPDVNEMNKLEAVEEAAYRDPAQDGGFRADEGCGNCGAYNQTEDILECIGLDDDDPQLGYCQIYKFVCESMYTCNDWVKGGPIKSEIQNAYRGDIL